MRAETAVPLIVAIPLATAAVLAICGRLLPRWAIDSLAALAALASAAAAAFVFNASLTAPIVYWFGGWFPRGGVAMGISFYADPVSTAMAALTSMLMLMGFMFSWKYFEAPGSGYHVLMLGLGGSIAGMLVASDMFNLFVFLELSTVAAVALSGYDSESPGPLQGAWNFGVICTIGAVLMLTGTALLYGRTGALNMAQVGAAIAGQSDPLILVAFAFVLCGLLVKAGVVPFHFWLADAHAVAATPACVLFSGIMVETMVVASFRAYYTLFSTGLGAHDWIVRDLLLWFGAATAILGAVMSLLQGHIKRLLAYSTISHVGLVLISCALMESEAFAGAMLYVVAHGLVKGALFLSAGVMKQRFDTIEESELHGRARGWYSLLVIYVAGAIGLASIPPFTTAMADELVHSASVEHGWHWISYVFSFAAIVTAGAVLRSAGAIFFGWGPKNKGARGQSKSQGGESEAEGGGRNVTFVMQIPAVLLLAGAIGLSFVPALLYTAQRAGADFTDGPRVRDRILATTHAPLKTLEEQGMHNKDDEPWSEKFGVKWAAVRLVLAFGVAFGALGRKRLGIQDSRVLRAPVKFLRDLHSGIVPDYAVWLIAGVATFAATLLLAIRT